MPLFKSKEVKIEMKKNKLADLYEKIELHNQAISEYEKQLKLNRKIIDEIGISELTKNEIKAKNQYLEAQEAISKLPTLTDALIIDDLDEIVQTAHLAQLEMSEAEIRYRSAVEITGSRAIRDAEIAKTNAKYAEREAKYDAEIAEIDERLTKIRAHNKAVIQDWLGDVREIKQDFVEEQRQITRNNRTKRQR